MCGIRVLKITTLNRSVGSRQRFLSTTQKDTVQWIGYLLGDQAPAYREQLEGFWRNGWMLLRGRMSPPPPLLFPLLDQHVSKASVVRDIDKCLIMSTWVCEIPNTVGEFALKRIVPCKRCQPCRLLRNTIENWEEDNNKKYYTEAIKALNPDLYPPNDPCKEIAV